MKLLTAIVAFAMMASLASADPKRWKQEWPNTDFSKSSVAWNEIMSGGPPKDGIPALSDPQFVKVSQKQKIGDREPVITVEIDGQTPRAYPVRYLTWHEIVNDKIGNTPVAVTFCPLCNSGITFDRRVNGKLRTFGVSGKLRNSDMVMYDRETESWWQQAIGKGIVGVHEGDTLTQLPSWMESWAEFKDRNPKGLVMAQPAFPRRYGANPYAGYDSLSRPLRYDGEMPPHQVPPLARVVRVGDSAWTVQRVREEGGVSENGIKIFWSAGQASALDKQDINGSKDVGTIRVKDAKTGKDLPHDVMFAFAFHAFYPDGTWMLGN